MKAIWFKTPGEAAQVLTVGEREKPTPGEGQVLVRLYASAVNPSDVKKRAGLQPAGLENGYVIPHSDGAGVIEAVGQGVDAKREGERVWVYQAQFQRHQGTAAQYVAVDSFHAASLPDAANWHIGACMGIPAMTAHRAVFADGAVENKTVLVTGASGRVGYYAAQWAKAAGATVFATAGSKERLAPLENFSLDGLFNYREDEVASALVDATDGKGVDRIIDVEFGKNVEQSAQMIAVNGAIVTYSSSLDPQPTLPFYPLMFKNVLLRTVLVYNMPNEAKQKAMDDIYNMLSANQFNHRIDSVTPLDRTFAAHEAIEEGGCDGCVVIDID